MKNIAKILKLSQPLFRKTALLAVLVLLMSVVQQVQPFFIKFIVDTIETQIKTGAGSMLHVSWLMVGLLFANLLSSVLDSVNMRFGDYINSRLRTYLTEEFYRKVFTLPQKYFDSNISGKILNQLNRGIASIQDFMGMMTNFVLPAMFQSIFTIGILFYYQPIIGLMALLIFPFYILVSSYSTKRWGAHEVEKNQLEDVSRGRIVEVIGNIRLVRGFLTQHAEWKFVSQTLAKINAIYDKQSTTYHIINFCREFGLEIVLVLISLVVFRQTFLLQLSLGEMVLILQLLNQMRRPLFAMSFILERIQMAESGSKEYFEIMSLESTEAFETQATPLSKRVTKPTLRFENVGFEYEKDGTNVLSHMNFTIEQGQTVALVGHSGAGKSTIINLILKYYSPTKGEIYLQDKAYSTLSHQEIRSHISLVFQENELFSTTIFENVAYGIPRATRAQVIDALKKANAYDFVMKLPNTINASIGERGVKLSGGQKQRIQIARAIMHNSPILILDEATSSLDSKSENAIQKALEVLMKDKLVIIIAHRFSTIQSADKILVIDKGKLVDAGSPSELARKKGIYSELLSYQIQGNEALLKKYDLS